MRTPAAIEAFLRAKRSGLALVVFALGLLALPAAFTAGGIYYHSGSPVSWRPALDYFEYGAAALGLLCCVIAPFLPRVPTAQRLFMSFLGFALYVFDLLFSTVASIMVFGFQN